MITKSTSDRSEATSSDNYRLASALFLLCLHLTAFAIALLTPEPESAVTRRHSNGP